MMDAGGCWSAGSAATGSCMSKSIGSHGAVLVPDVRSQNSVQQGHLGRPEGRGLERKLEQDAQGHILNDRPQVQASLEFNWPAFGLRAERIR